jgi:hypothetical protein
MNPRRFSARAANDVDTARWKDLKVPLALYFWPWRMAKLQFFHRFAVLSGRAEARS